MGLLVNGHWQDEWYDTKSNKGAFKRKSSHFTQNVKADGSTPYLPEKGRYRLYVSLACPWAHRTLIFRGLKGLEDCIDVVIVEPLMLEKGWILQDKTPLHTIYTQTQKDYSGRVTVPILWDKKTNTIVNNESSDIIRMLNVEFNDFTTKEAPDFYPAHLRSQIDEMNEFIYPNINNGVYKTGFATTQSAYEEAYESLFNALDKVEHVLSQKRYLIGDQITEADWRLFTTLVRFDPVYVGHFKCNKQRIIDYPNMWGYVKELYQMPSIADSVNMDHIKQHYYASHTMINPTRVVPVGPQIDFMAPHGRG